MGAVRRKIHGHQIGGPMACRYLSADVWEGATTRPYQEFRGEFFGASRSGVFVSGRVSASVSLGSFGVTVDDAFGMLSRARRVAVPDTDAQVEWVREFVRRVPESGNRMP
jgi:hypothetical protein